MGVKELNWYLITWDREHTGGIGWDWYDGETAEDVIFMFKDSFPNRLRPDIQPASQCGNISGKSGWQNT